MFNNSRKTYEKTYPAIYLIYRYNYIHHMVDA